MEEFDEGVFMLAEGCGVNVGEWIISSNEGVILSIDGKDRLRGTS